jgi:hypothetical protein
MSFKHKTTGKESTSKKKKTGEAPDHMATMETLDEKLTVISVSKRGRGTVKVTSGNKVINSMYFYRLTTEDETGQREEYHVWLSELTKAQQQQALQLYNETKAAIKEEQVRLDEEEEKKHEEVVKDLPDGHRI